MFSPTNEDLIADALLADLQTTLENNRANLSASANSVASANYEQAHVATSHNQLYHYQEVDDVHVSEICIWKQYIALKTSSKSTNNMSFYSLNFLGSTVLF